jgi:hypothetical protein
LLNRFGIVTGGNGFACDLINKIFSNNILFIISNVPIDEKRCDVIVAQDIELHMKKFLKFPIKKLLFIEWYKPIPECLSNYYDCFILKPSFKEKTGTWEAILGEVLMTRANQVGCHIFYKNIPFIFSKLDTSKYEWKTFNRKKDIFKSDLFFSLQKDLQENMFYLVCLFVDLIFNHKVEFKDYKVFVDGILMIGGVNADGFINSKRKENESNNRIC